MLPKHAKLYVTLVIAGGCAILLLAAKSWSSANFNQFAIYLGLAALASSLKIRIPGVESTVTPNFVFLLLAVHACSFSEVVTIGAVMAVVQCVWRSAKSLRLVQIAFSVAAIVVSAAVAYQLSHFLLAGNAWVSAISSMILTGCVYFPLNSTLVAIVIGLSSNQSFGQIWRRCESVVFPYFMGGIAFAALVSSAYSPASMWKGAVVLIPAVVLAHLYFLNRSAHTLSPKPSA